MTNHPHMNPAWYVLYGGTSVDGRGEGKFLGRTTDPSVAHAHNLECAKNPYSVGHVVEFTDSATRVLPPPPCPKCGQPFWRHFGERCPE